MLFLVEGDAVIEATTLIVPSVPFIPSKGSRLLPTWLKEFLLACFLDGAPKERGPERIYISRSQAGCRRVANESELIDFLKTQGFTIVHLEHLPIADQAHLFAEAHVVMGPHGSGFANLIFARPGTQVIEIDHGLEGKEQRSWFRQMSALMQCHYHPFYAGEVSEDALEQDIFVGLPQLQQSLRAINL